MLTDWVKLGEAILGAAFAYFPGIQLHPTEMSSTLNQSGLNFQNGNPLGRKVRALEAEVENLKKRVAALLSGGGPSAPGVAGPPGPPGPPVPPCPCAPPEWVGWLVGWLAGRTTW